MLAEHGAVVDFWMPTIKTHCYVRVLAVVISCRASCVQVVYETVEAATAAAEAVHNVEWPVGNNSKLRVKYVPVEDATDAIAVGRGEKLPSGAQTGMIESTMYCTWVTSCAVVVDEPAPPKVDKVGKAEDVTLEDLFRRTTAQPAIYWLPVSTDKGASISNGRQ